MVAMSLVERRDRGVNFLVADYRGYGLSGGVPTVSAMLGDSHHILDYARIRLEANGYGGPLVVMGRSLGSAPALELAAHRDGIDGLIIESGFALTARPCLTRAERRRRKCCASTRPITTFCFIWA